MTRTRLTKFGMTTIKNKLETTQNFVLQKSIFTNECNRKLWSVTHPSK